MENHRKSKAKRNRKSGFRARMQTKRGRRIINKKRRRGRTTNVSAHM
ncbi:MAG: 50S ribosomal protein L34 [Phycisphaerales bacterium]|nr:MAG: 50S ribosomal protein L34 [Phycisphaerales bacterium]